MDFSLFSGFSRNELFILLGFTLTLIGFMIHLVDDLNEKVLKYYSSFYHKYKNHFPLSFPPQIFETSPRFCEICVITFLLITIRLCICWKYNLYVDFSIGVLLLFDIFLCLYLVKHRILLQIEYGGHYSPRA